MGRTVVGAQLGGTMKPITALILSAAALVALEGCAASRALDQPHEKDLNVLKPGSDRDLVRAELGAPLPSTAGNSCDVFAFPEGSTGWRYMRALSYSVLDVGTLGLSEIVTNPVESSVGKTKMQLRVCYTDQQQVRYTEKLEVGVPAKLITGTYPPPPLLPATPPVAAVETAILPPATPPMADTAAVQPTGQPVPPTPVASAGTTVAASPATQPAGATAPAQEATNRPSTN